MKRVQWLALLLVATFTYVMPASAQSADTWKSIAIIGGSTAAGAYVGHKVAGTKGAYIGAAVGATAGYAIDRRRRQNGNYNADYPYGNSGPYGDNGPYSSDPNSANGGYYPDSQNNYPYPSDQGSNGYYSDRNQLSRRK
jgi:hypothetical protein